MGISRHMILGHKVLLLKYVASPSLYILLRFISAYFAYISAQIIALECVGKYSLTVLSPLHLQVCYNSSLLHNRH